MDLQTQANEVKKALGETVLLSDGRYGFVISELEDSGPDKWKCHVCSRVITTERAMLMHLSHPIHMSRLRVPHHSPDNFKRIANSKNDAAKKKIADNRIQAKEKENEKDKEKEKVVKKEDNNKEETWSNTVRPGEPIPPGMEDIVESKCQIQETLDNYSSGPLIGIEYIVELVSSEEGIEPKYICLLCEKKGDPRSVMVHLTSHNHALRYISCFFRTAGNVINLIPKTRENRKGVGMAVNKIAEQIEKHYGRLKPTIAIAETFTQQKYEILSQIDEKTHFRETPSTTFIQYCTTEKIKEYSKIAEDEMLSSIRNSKKPEDFEENKIAEKNDIQKLNPSKKPNENVHDIPNHDRFTGKLSFSIGKPERSLGRNKAPEQPNLQSVDDKDDDEVIFVPSNNEPIEVLSMSSISSTSDESRMNRHRDRERSRSRSRSRSRGRGRGRSPPRRRGRSIERRRTPPIYRRERHRSRTRSRSRQRYYRESLYARGARDDIDRLRQYQRVKRSPSREKDRDRLRYEARMRMDRERHRRSYSSERDSRKRMSPLPKSRHDRISPPKGRHEKSPEIKRKKVSNDYKTKIEIYRSKLHELEVEMDNKLKYFRERPEKHPQYSEEWKNFWNRRYKEIQQSGKDPNTYDFKPEWIIFWDERMKQLHEEELIAKKDELKSLLPEEEKGPSSDLQDISPPTPESQKDITVDDIKNTWKALTGSDIKAPAKQKSLSPDRKSPVPRRSPSPWEQESRSSHSKAGKGKHPWDAAPPIVHCLRMLSVLEQQLGSLGPKALELMSKALAMEKSKINESMTLLYDEEIHIFFETVKEKIRGQLIAGIVARYLVNSCRSVINTVESMLAAYPPKPKQPVPVAPPAMIQPEPVKVAGVGMVNKMAVAQQIAEVLVAQGKTDVTQQELEELINAVVGIASSSNANLNQSSTAFISQLNLQKSTANSHINELLGNLIASAQKSLVPPSMIPVEKVVAEIANPVTQPQVSSALLQHSATPTASILSIQNTLKPRDAVTNPKIEHVMKGVPVTNKREFSPEMEVEKETDSVSDEDLKERLIKFKTLNRDEQQNLIALLKDLESKDPQRVEKLRKYVAVGLANQSSSAVSKLDNIQTESLKDSGRLSPFSSRAGGTNPAPEEKKILTMPYMIDSDHDEDDDDYSVEDVYKSVSEKLKKKEDERKTDQRLNLSLDILDENSTSSRHSFSNPGKPSVTPPSYTQAKTFNSDLRNTPYGGPNPPQPSKNEYMYSVADPANIQPSESYIPPPLERNFPTDQWTGGSGMNRDNDWSGNKQWSHGDNQDPYNATSRVQGGYPNSYDGGSYNGPQEHYKTTAGQQSYYGGEQEQGYMAAGSIDKPYPYNTNQSYQSSLYNSQSGPYNYLKPPAQGGYYNNYRQY